MAMGRSQNEMKIEAAIDAFARERNGGLSSCLA